MGIIPNPLKAFLIVHPVNIEARKSFGLCRGFKLFTGTLYLGSFIEDDGSKRDFLKERTKTWERNIHTIIETAGKYP